MNQPSNTTEQDIQQEDAESAILQVSCDPSLKRTLRGKLNQAGFSSVSDAIRTLVRDFVSGRIIYRSGILISQVKS